MKNNTYINILSARREYEALPSSEWRKDYFNEENGGHLVTSWKRIEQANKNQTEMIKFEKEHDMSLIFAQSGLKIRHYEDEKKDGSYDVLCGDKKGDLKKTKGFGNVIKYARYATKEQGAEIILFEFSEWKAELRDILSEMVRKNLHGYYFISGNNVVHSF